MYAAGVEPRRKLARCFVLKLANCVNKVTNHECRQLFLELLRNARSVQHYLKVKKLKKIKLLVILALQNESLAKTMRSARVFQTFPSLKFRIKACTGNRVFEILFTATNGT